MSQCDVGKIRAGVQAMERMEIRTSEKLGIQAFFPALSVEEAAEKVKMGMLTWENVSISVGLQVFVQKRC